MFQDSPAFNGFSVSDIEAARVFYGETLGIVLRDQPGMGFYLAFASGQAVFVYPKADHTPASFTVLNFPIDDIDTTVDDLISKGVVLEHYEGMHQDSKGIARGPAGNILAVLQQA
jgi:catechol 2,3-dioxygenase-like lactoylglutathione lyase family enzyme